ncbi:MAG TPA: hypothetical protein VF411_12940 [Bacteroidia bacterium]
MKSNGHIPKMFDKSRFNRRLHQIGRLLYDLFTQVGSYLKDICCELHYIIDSSPVAVCDSYKISRLYAPSIESNLRKTKIFCFLLEEFQALIKGQWSKIRLIIETSFRSWS